MPVWCRWPAVLIVCALGSSVVADQEQKPQETPAVFKALRYRLIGPAAGGRVSRATGVPGDPSTYYAATASGGVWKSTDAGATWRSIFDDQPIWILDDLAAKLLMPFVIVR